MDYARTLAELAPERVATQALKALMRHVAQLTLGWGVALPALGDVCARDELYEKLCSLTRYAQRGLPAGPWVRAEQVEDGLLEALWALYGGPCAAKVDLDRIDTTEARDEYDDVHLMLVAAVARWRLLEEMASVTTQELSILAGREVEEDLVELGSYVGPEAAVAWLREQGVAGFGDDAGDAEEVSL